MVGKSGVRAVEKSVDKSAAALGDGQEHTRKFAYITG
jgi:hypothetical protein